MNKLLRAWAGYFSRRSFVEAGGYAEIWRLAFPLIIMSASYVVLMISDRMLLAWHDTVDVAAAVPAGGLNFSLFSFYAIMIGFSSSLTAQYFGAKDPDSCVRTAWNAFYLALASGVGIVAINLPLGRWIILNSGHEAIILERELIFFYSLIPSGIFSCMSGAFFGFFSGIGRTAIIAKINTTMCLLNVLLDYLLIFGCAPLGIPEMGIAGAGIATSICTAIGFGWVFCDFLLLNQREFVTRGYWGFRFYFVSKLVCYGAPSGLQVMLGSGAFTVFTFMIGYAGVAALAASNIVISINNLAFAPIQGFCDATSIIVGQYIGRGRKFVAERAAFRAWRMIFPYILVLGVVFVLFPHELAILFSPHNVAGQEDFAAVAALSARLLVLAAVVNLCDSVRFVFMGALRGAGDTRMILYIIGGCAVTVMVPGVLILAKLLHQPVYVLWCFLTFYVALLAALLLWRFLSGRWKKINLIDRAQPSSDPAEEVSAS